MDSDHFVPIWAIACMEDIKALTTDMDLILDVLRGIMPRLSLVVYLMIITIVNLNFKVLEQKRNLMHVFYLSYKNKAYVVKTQV